MSRFQLPENKSLVLHEGDSFASEAAVSYLMHAIWGDLDLDPQWIKILRQEAIDATSSHPTKTWKKVLDEWSATAARARNQPPSGRNFLSKIFSRTPQPQTTPGKETIKQLQCRLKKHKEITQSNRSAYHGIADDQEKRKTFWPDPTHPKSPRSLFEETPLGNRTPLVSKETPIASAGSCFAMEIAHWLLDNGYNYLITDDRPSGPGATRPMASARWGIIFNAPAFRQMVEHAFGVHDTPKLLWNQEHAGRKMFADPFREDILFESVEEYEADYEVHRANARRALETSKVFVLTLGMAEVWFLRNTEFYCSRCQWGLASELVDHKVMDVAETVAELERMLGVIRRFNPEIQFIVSVSPVPLHATFRREECSIITANAYSKSMLRVAAELFANRNEGVHYFPSYETVMYCTKNAWMDDQRHVSREAVAKVMRLFTETFVKS